MARPAPCLTELCARIAVVTFEPGSHDLIGGGAEHRRRYLDWGLFHVEPDFLPWWRRYARALKQRNAALKSGPSPGGAGALGARAGRGGRSDHPACARPTSAAGALRGGAGRPPTWASWARLSWSSGPAGSAASCRWPTPCC
jgi:hypothetical protein